MKILLDHNLPVQIRKYMKGHLCMSARSMGWPLLENGDLIRAADRAGFDVLLTADRKMYHEQSHITRRVALVVLTHPELKFIKPNLALIKAALERSMAGGYELVELPSPDRGER